MAAACLAEALEELGYPRELRRTGVGSLVSGVAADVVAFTHIAPQDLRTSAIAGFTAFGDELDALLDAARMLATPFALIVEPTGDIGLYPVEASRQRRVEAVRRIAPEEIHTLRESELAIELAPRAIRAAKAGMRQLTLFPVDARLLVDARDRSVSSISTRLKHSFTLALEENIGPTKAARIAIESLGAVIVRDKYQINDPDGHNIVEGALARHGEYFWDLAEWQNVYPVLVKSILHELGKDVDYSAVDARSINAVYEQLFLTPRLQKRLGSFHTDQQLASRILDHLPIEEIPPESRYVVDPACGAGNLLLAAQERLENLSPGRWSAQDTHQWLKTHIYGADIEPMAVEIAKLSLLVSSLPLGNAWQVEQHDALTDPAGFTQPPTVWVTNPPWYNRKGSRDEVAAQFLKTAVEYLADGGLLACILPASWLTAGQHRRARHEITQKCDIFEVWRLPRDMFKGARQPAAVVFAQKRETTQRMTYVFRWLTAGSEHRAEFLNHGAVQFQSTEQMFEGAELISGPVNGLAKSGVSVGNVVNLRGGVVQRGRPDPASPGEGVPFLARDTRVLIHRSLSTDLVTWVSNPGENFLTSIDKRSDLLQAPKLLVQANRSPDNAWRLRPIIDSIGVVPVNSWQIIVSQPQTLFALNAFFSTSIASCFVHSRATTRWISLGVLRQIPLPHNWSDYYEQRFAELGRMMVDQAFDLAPLVDKAERLARRAFDLDDETIAAIERTMASFKAADGRVRFHEVHALSDRADHHPDGFYQAPGTVLSVGRTKVMIWIHGGPAEGLTIDLHSGIPGWLLEEDAMFELTGDPQTGQYRFHRTAYLPSDVVFGVSDNKDVTSLAEELEWGSNQAERPLNDRRF